MPAKKTSTKSVPDKKIPVKKKTVKPQAAAVSAPIVEQKPVNTPIVDNKTVPTPATGNKHENTMAIVALVSGICFFIPFASLLAIIFGIVGLNQISKTGEKGRGMAIAGIVLGAFFMLAGMILMILFFMLIPAYSIQ